jgi:hypothetical protein
VTVDPKTTDRYGRTVAEVTLSSGTNLNRELVKQGWCWWFSKYAPNDTVLSDLEANARKQRLGIWADPQPVAPWEFRKARAEQRAKRKATPQLKLSEAGIVKGATTSAATPGGLVTEQLTRPILGNRRSHIYHRTDCPNYSEIAEQNQVPFMNMLAAQEAGYRLAGNCP